MRSRALVFALAMTGAQTGCPPSAREPPRSSATVPERVVSLSPAITETLAALGEADRVVAVSDYCAPPGPVCDRPSVGHTLRPDLEAIARMKPDLIVYEATQQGTGADLGRLGPALQLPWLTLREVAGSIRELGERVDRADAAARIADQLTTRLGRAADAAGPEVLLLLGYPEPTGTFWFMKPASLHGRLVTAIGARPPAALVDWKGPPKMSAEDLVRLDPEWIVVLAREAREAPLSAIQRLATLQAVKKRQLRVLVDPHVFSTGPSIVRLIPTLSAKVKSEPEP